MQGGLPGFRSIEDSGDPGRIASVPDRPLQRRVRLAFNVDVDVDAGGPGFDPDAE
jgi:hypothetical protein